MANPKTYRELRRTSTTSPMFEDEGTELGLDAPFLTNAHPASEYQKPGRLHTETIGRFDSEGRYVEVERTCPMEEHVRNQVLSSIGERAGTMTFASQLTRSKGVGSLGDTGGVQARGSGRQGEKAGVDERYPLEGAGPSSTAFPRTKGGY